jgi:hypothetical protein
MIRNPALHAHASTGRQHAFGITTCAICPSCAREHRDDSRVCTECGTPLTLAVCAACEAINAIGAASCHQCGAQFEREPWNIDAGPAPAACDLPESPVEDVTFVLDAVDTAVTEPSDADDVIDLGEKRYVGPDARQHALADATPIAFAERAMHALPLGEAPLADSPHDARATTTPARRAHLGVAFAVVMVAGAIGYWAFDVPTLRGVVANSLARAIAMAPSVPPARTRPSVERANNQAARASSSANSVSASVRADDRSTSGVTTGNTSTAADAMTERTSSEAPATEAAGASAPDAKTERPVATKSRNATVKHRPSSRAHAQPAPSPRADPDAVATKRLIERDLGRFLAR